MNYPRTSVRRCSRMRQRSAPGRTSRRWPGTSSSAGSRMPSRRPPECGGFGERRRSWRKDSAGRAVGRGASTATAQARSAPRTNRLSGAEAADQRPQWPLSYRAEEACLTKCSRMSLEAFALDRLLTSHVGRGERVGGRSRLGRRWRATARPSRRRIAGWLVGAPARRLSVRLPLPPRKRGARVSFVPFGVNLGGFEMGV
jgi:hypothetical protein